MNKKKAKFAVMFIDWIILIYLMMINIIPNIFGQTIHFFKPFMNTYIFIYSILATILFIFGIIGLVFVYLITYTSKLDSKKEPLTPDYIPVWKSFVTTIKNIMLVYFASISGFHYIATLTSIMIIYSILYFVIQRDYFIKMTKLKLAYKEE